MNWKALIAGAIFFGMLILAGHAGDPMTFKEISMLVRNADQPQHILDEAAYRKLLQRLSPQEESVLLSEGATPAFIAALRAPGLLASPAAVAAAANNRPQPYTENSLALPQKEANPLFAAQAVPTGDHFTAGLNSAKTAPPIAILPDYAFSLSQLEQAKAKARSEGKPLGFVLMWGQFYNVMSDTRAAGSQPAFAHFYQAFHNSLVLVFVRHETELNRVPPAVRQGFNGPDEGGFAPNMAVVDASASEFITEIPMAVGGKPLDGTGRDELFKQGADKIERWLASHPTALAGAPAAR